jgi:amino acid transporter
MTTTAATEASEQNRLNRHLGVTDAVVIGLGSMIGAGVFAAIGPAAAVAGSGLLIGLAIAGFVAFLQRVRGTHQSRVLRHCSVCRTAVLRVRGLCTYSHARRRGSRSLDALAPAVRIGAAIASLGVLLSLIAGVSRTVFAMSSNNELPKWFDAVHPTHKVPHRADIAIGLLVGLLVSVSDVRHVIGFSSFCVLTYYAITNAAAWTLPHHQRRWPRALAGIGIIGCVALAITLPSRTVLTGTSVLMVGALTWTIRHRPR